MLTAIGLLLALAAAFAGGAYLGMRRAFRSWLSQTSAERRVTSLEAQTRQAVQETEAERRLLERLPEPVILFGPDRLIHRLNGAARAALGGELASLLRHPGFLAALERAQASGQTEFADLTLPVPVARELTISVLPVEGRLLVMLSDRTRERAVERMRADFVANASHELRTPLTSLIGFIDTLRGPAADDKEAQTRFLGIMAEQAQRMNRLIDDLLSLSRIELTEHVRPDGKVPLASLLQRAVAGFSPAVAASGTELVLHCPQGLPDVAGDEDQLMQVLQNLIENAIKYGSERGKVLVAAEPAVRGGEEGVQIRVSDDGPGIPPTHLPRLTERFYRVSTPRSRAVGGTGLGLAIVKHIVNRHRGVLKIESQEGGGTTVLVWLPAMNAGTGPG